MIYVCFYFILFFAILSAKDASLEIPENFTHQAQLPHPTLAIVDFLSFKLPRLSSEIISSKTSTWFSTDSPTANNDALISRPVPSPEFIKNLTAALKLSKKRGSASENIELED
ncbi:hypothetical protein BYT27DRAFT_7204832 [Phlegmacium glaucopus]|nr:hypothetical protein BYT27DRAFT_7204832 [Phlegmacium glaucopus]